MQGSQTVFQIRQCAFQDYQQGVKGNGPTETNSTFVRDPPPSRTQSYFSLGGAGAPPQLEEGSLSLSL